MSGRAGRVMIMEVKVQESEAVSAEPVETTGAFANQDSAAQEPGTRPGSAGSGSLPDGYVDAYESSPTLEPDHGAHHGLHPSDTSGPESTEGGSKPGRKLKASLLKLSAIGHALTSTVGSAERAARSVVDRVRGLFQESRERSDFMTRRNARRLGDEPAKAADRLGSTPQAQASAETSTASPRIDPDLFKNL